MPQILYLLGQILDGLEHLHKHGVYHSDLKSPNILVFRTEEGECVLKVSGCRAASEREEEM
jgi:serine/threonine protein kinase